MDVCEEIFEEYWVVHVTNLYLHHLHYHVCVHGPIVEKTIDSKDRPVWGYIWRWGGRGGWRESEV